jgi:hypothetical protein
MARREKAPQQPIGKLIVECWKGSREAAASLAQLLAGAGEAKSVSQLAAWFGVSPTTVKTGWRRSRDMPGKEGKWPLAEILLWKLDRETQTAATEMSQRRDASVAPLEAKRIADARKAEVETALKEMKLRQLAGDLLDRGDVEREISERIAIARHCLGRVPATLLPRLPKALAPEIIELVRNEIESALHQLASLETLECLSESKTSSES